MHYKKTLFIGNYFSLSLQKKHIMKPYLKIKKIKGDILECHKNLQEYQQLLLNHKSLSDKENLTDVKKKRYRKYHKE